MVSWKEDLTFMSFTGLDVSIFDSVHKNIMAKIEQREEERLSRKEMEKAMSSSSIQVQILEQVANVSRVLSRARLVIYSDFSLIETTANMIKGYALSRDSLEEMLHSNLLHFP
jgi:uncharacterized protein (UPF0147 family)